MRGTDKDPGKGQNDRRRVVDIQERRTKALEQIATALGQIHHELVQLRVKAANVNVALARKR
jgi:ribosomal protein L29